MSDVYTRYLAPEEDAHRIAEAVEHFRRWLKIAAALWPLPVRVAGWIATALTIRGTLRLRRWRRLAERRAREEAT